MTNFCHYRVTARHFTLAIFASIFASISSAILRRFQFPRRSESPVVYAPRNRKSDRVKFERWRWISVCAGSEADRYISILRAKLDTSVTSLTTQWTVHCLKYFLLLNRKNDATLTSCVFPWYNFEVAMTTTGGKESPRSDQPLTNGGPNLKTHTHSS